MRIFLLLCMLAIPSIAYADTPPDQLSSNEREQLVEFQKEIVVVTRLQKDNVLDKATVDLCMGNILSNAAKVIGRDSITAADFKTYLGEANQTANLGVFLTMMIVLAGIVLMLAVVGLLGWYLWPLLINIPVGVYELAAYAGTAGLLLTGFLPTYHIWTIQVRPLWFVVPGLFAVPLCVFLTKFLHFRPELNAKKVIGDDVYIGPFRFSVVISGICALVWAATAVYYHQEFPDAGIPHFAAFIAIMALESFLGFSVITMPGCIAMGWTKDDEVPRSTTASFILLAAYVAMTIIGGNIPQEILLFKTGCLFMGAFVYFLGLLVMASKWYSFGKEDTGGRYLYMQFLTILSGVAALHIGNAYNISSLVGIGGTFFAIYLLEKYYEIPWEGIGWAWSLLGVAVSMYFFIGFANQNPQYFLWGIQ